MKVKSLVEIKGTYGDIKVNIGDILEVEPAGYTFKPLFDEEYKPFEYFFVVGTNVIIDSRQFKVMENKKAPEEIREVKIEKTNLRIV